MHLTKDRKHIVLSDVLEGGHTERDVEDEAVSVSFHIDHPPSSHDPQEHARPELAARPRYRRTPHP
jgi:hypothetical protein